MIVTLQIASTLKTLVSAVQSLHVCYIHSYRESSHSLYLYLLCINNFVTNYLDACYSAVCQHGDARLVGPTNYTGRVEVCVRETWSTVCDNMWSAMDANVVCRQLGYSRFSTFAKLNTLG